MPDDYSTDPASEFMLAYMAAAAGGHVENKPKPRHKQNTLGWLFDMYQRSAKFHGLAVGTQRARANIIKSIVEKNGDFHLCDITERSIRQGRERRSATPEAANNFLKTMKAAFAWGIDSGLLDGVVKSDPTANVKKIITKSKGFHTWTVDEIERYEACHPVGTMARLAMDIMIYTGLRRQDACQLGKQHIKSGEIHFRTGKTGEWVYLPLIAPLARSIEETPTGDLAFLATERGKPFSSPASFGNWFRKQCEAAGVPGRAHGLRKAGAVLAAERGATTSQMMAIFGWTSQDMAALYTRTADRKKLGIEHGKLLDRK